MSRKAFVHIGTHKTGTTYLQKWMLGNQDPLAELGLFYPKIGMMKRPTAQFKLSADARDVHHDLTESAAWRTLQEQLMFTDKDVILSAETFSDKIRHEDVTSRIVDFFNALNMKTEFIVFLRDVPAYMNSRYVQDAKHLRSADSFADFVEKHRDDINYNYVKLLQPFENAAPVTVLPFARKGGLIEHKFLNAMGRSKEEVAKLDWHELAVQNLSFGPGAIRIARQLVRELPADISRRELKEKVGCYKHLCDVYGLNDTGFIGCDVETADAIRADFSEYTNAIAKKYFTQSWPETIPPERMFEKFEQADMIGKSTSQKTIHKIVDQVHAAGSSDPGVQLSMPHKYFWKLDRVARRTYRKHFGGKKKKT